MVLSKNVFRNFYLELSVEAAISLSFCSDRWKFYFLLFRIYEKKKVDFTVEKNILKSMGEIFIFNLV